MVQTHNFIYHFQCKSNVHLQALSFPTFVTVPPPNTILFYSATHISGFSFYPFDMPVSD